MICVPCKTGADLSKHHNSSLIVVRHWHDQCKGGTHCTCQHRIGRKNVQ